MSFDARKTILAVAIVIAAAIPLHRAVSFDLNDLTANSGLVSDIYTLQCRDVRIIEAINLIKGGYLKQIVFDTLRQFKNNAISFAAQIALCQISSTTVFGSGSNGLNCNWELGGFTASAIQRQFLDKLEKDFFARCTADAMRKQVGDDIRRIINENGPDGGPAYVSDWVGLYESEDARAINRFNAILVNTEICPHFRDRAYSYFNVPQSYIDSPPSLTGLGLRVDGGSPFNLAAGCSLPDGLTPQSLDSDFTGNGGFDALRLLMRPENNFEGFVRLAQHELANQRNTVVRAAESEAIAGGGYRGLYGSVEESCINRDPNGNCLALGPVRQPSGGVRDANAAVVQSEFDWINNSDTMNTLLGDVRQRLVSLVLDIQQEALSYDIEIDGAAQGYVDIAEGTAPPDDATIPGGAGVPGPGGGTDPGDTSCTGGNPLCVCVRDAPELSGLRSRVAEATRAAIIQHPEYVSADGSTVLPGQNRLFLQAVCETTIGQALNCHPNAGSDDEVVVDAGSVNVSVDIITSSGGIRIPGQTIAACQPGVQ